MPLVNNRDEVVLEHVGVKGMKWGVRKKYYTRKVKKAKRRAEVQRGVGKMLGEGARKRGLGEGEAKRQEQIGKSLGKKYDAKAAAAQKKLNALGPKPVPKPRKPMTAETRAKIEIGAAVAGALIGAFGTVAMWKLSGTPTGSGPKAQQIAEMNKFFTGG